MVSRLGLAVVATACMFGVVRGAVAPVSASVRGQATRPLVSPAVSFAEPSISPDGSEIAFVSAGDIWIVPASGGEAHLLVSHPANESRPLFSPDGRRLAFMSARGGGMDIYVLTFATGEVERMTFDGGNQLDAWSRDGRWIYFSSTGRDIAGMNDIYRVSSGGGTPMIVSGDRYVNEYFAAPAPDGKTLAFTARGMASSQWWRKGHSHIDEAEIWLLRDGEPAAYEAVTNGGAKEMWPMWSADGRRLYYVSDRSGAQNIWTRPIGGQPAAVTHFDEGRVLWPVMAADGRSIVFERDFQVWKLDVATGRAGQVKIERRGLAAGPSVDHLSLSNQIQELALSPDGKKLAFVVHGEVFAASAKDGGDAARVTRTHANESHIAWAPDSRRLVYESDRDGTVHLFQYDFRTSTETQVTRDARDDFWPRVSPDGKWLAFQRGLRELHVMPFEAPGASAPTDGSAQASAVPADRVIARGYLADRLDSGRPMMWSPDSRWIAYLATGPKGFTNVWVTAVAGGEPRAVSFLANTNAGEVSWSPDGTFILFDSGQRTETTQLARVDLLLRTPKFREDLFRDLFQEENPKQPAPTTKPATVEPGEKDKPAAPDKPAEKPTASADRKAAVRVDIVFDDIRRRLSLVPVGVDLGAHAISPDGKTMVLAGGAAGQTNLYTYSLDELGRERAVARQITSTAGGKSFVQFGPDSKEVFYLEDGRIQAVTLDRREPRTVSVTAEMDVEFAKEKMEVFAQAWTYLRDQFYDPDYHGANWEAVRAAYEPRVAAAGTSDEVRRLISMMVGELNASHLGISGPGGGGAPTGRLGLRFDRVEYETTHRLRVSEVVPLGPAAITRAIKTGDYLDAVDGVAVGAETNLDELLGYKVGRRVVLTMSGADAKAKREVAVRPVNASTEKGLLYREWVEGNRAYVARASGGRLGYVHMIDMSAGALSQLFVDLDAENHGRDGVVVDIRNNNGGFVNVYAIDVLARRGYLTMVQRGLFETPARTVLGQRALEAPTILVTNQHSLSDAEDFTEGYRALKLGKVVGEPTAGWIIYTWSARLIDGSSLRLPRTKVTASDGTPMELHPRPVDIPVTRPIGEGLRGKDSQLDTAVKELLQQLGPRKTTS